MATAEGTSWKGFWMMLVMVCAAALLLLLTTVSDSHAMAKSRPGIGPADSGLEPVLACSYEHVGVEDHWQGHVSCEACLGEHHECEEKCYSTSWSCSARGTSAAGEVVRIPGSALGGESAAAEDALKQCRTSGVRGCEVEKCSELTRPYRRKTC